MPTDSDLVSAPEPPAAVPDPEGRARAMHWAWEQVRSQEVNARHALVLLAFAEHADRCRALDDYDGTTVPDVMALLPWRDLSHDLVLRTAGKLVTLGLLVDRAGVFRIPAGAFA